MNVRDSEFDQLLAEWPEGDPVVASRAPVEAAVEFARSHPRRRDWLAFLRRDAMTPRAMTGLRPVVILAAVVALLALAFGGAVIIGSRPDMSPTPTAEATPPPLSGDRLRAGTYRLLSSVPVHLTVPDGWDNIANIGVAKPSDGLLVRGSTVVITRMGDPRWH
jgi:hypothetical protein